MENTNIEREFGWDDTIEKETDFIVLEAGDYPFTVKAFERARHTGSDKLPPCNMAKLTLEIVAPDGRKTTLIHNLFLHSKTEGFLSAFFTSIGQKKKGEKLQMNWNAVVGATGRCKLAVEPYNGENYNKIKKFYAPEDSQTTTANQNNMFQF